MTTNIAKMGVFAVALGTDAYAAALGRGIAQQQPAPVASAVEPSDETPTSSKPPNAGRSSCRGPCPR